MIPKSNIKISILVITTNNKIGRVSKAISTLKLVFPLSFMMPCLNKHIINANGECKSVML
jgi:hypothetical protein